MTIDPARLRIVHYPEPVLRIRAKPVPAIDENVRTVVRRMIEIMHDAKGLGLAAPQVGLTWRLFVTAAHEGSDTDRVFINPRISVINREMIAHEEGCLSLPGIHVEIRRPAGIEITATDLHGEEFTLRSEAFLARVWQHEFDHIEGVLIIDRMSPIDRLATRKALKELRQT
jgi:peptide deformylase